MTRIGALIVSGRPVLRLTKAQNQDKMSKLTLLERLIAEK